MQLLRGNHPGHNTTRASSMVREAGCREPSPRIRRREKNVLDMPSYRPGHFTQVPTPKVLPKFPAHLIVQIMETLSANPAIVLRDVAFCQDIRRVGFHKRGPTSFAVVVIPIGLRWSVLLEADDCAESPFRIVGAPIRHTQSSLSPSVGEDRRGC